MINRRAILTCSAASESFDITWDNMPESWRGKEIAVLMNNEYWYKKDIDVINLEKRYVIAALTGPSGHLKTGPDGEIPRVKDYALNMAVYVDGECVATT